MSAAVARKRSTRSSQTTRQRASSTRTRSRRPQARPSRRAGSATVSRPSLQVFDQVAIRNRARRRYAIIATFVVLLAGLFAVALIQAQLVANQHRLDGLRSEIAESEAEHTLLQRQVEEASAPSAIIDQAMSMGMIRATNPVYLAPSEPAVAVPVPISLGSTPRDTEENRIVAAADPDVVSAGVEAALEAVSSSDTGSSSGTDSSRVVSQPTEGAATEASGETRSGSLAGTTVSSEGFGTPSPATQAERPSTVADIVVESALPVIDEVDTVATDDTSSGPAWAGAIAEAGNGG